MRVDYRKAFPGGMRAMAELERAVHSAPLEPELLELVRVRASQINGWNRLAVGLRSDVLGLDGLDLPGNADAAGSA
jgi:alkylhydroperoxidase family enzyme